MKSTKHFLAFCMFLVTLILLNITTTSIGDESTRLTVINKTGAYLHLFIEGVAYPYVAPDRSVTHSASARETFYVEAFYSPGQGRTGNVIDSTFTLPYTPARYYATGDHCSCEDPNSSTSCSEDAGVVTDPARGGSADWQITEDLFEDK